MTNLPFDLAILLKDAGLKVVEIPGWKTRGRPASKGSFKPDGVLWHHTGDQNGGEKYAAWLANVGRSDLPPPLCHLSIGRDGTVYVVAAGRANHAGVARASGPMPAGDGNSLYVGVECQNTGKEGWKPAQYNAMVEVAVLLGAIVGCPASHNRAHYETSVTGKWDPGDPHGRALGSNRVMDMDKFRADIAAKLDNPPQAKPTPKPTPKPAAKPNKVREARALARTSIAGLQRAAAILSEVPDSRAAAHEMGRGFEAGAATARDAYTKGPAK